MIYDEIATDFHSSRTILDQDLILFWCRSAAAAIFRRWPLCWTHILTNAPFPYIIRIRNKKGTINNFLVEKCVSIYLSLLWLLLQMTIINGQNSPNIIDDSNICFHSLQVGALIIYLSIYPTVQMLLPSTSTNQCNKRIHQNALLGITW